MKKETHEIHKQLLQNNVFREDNGYVKLCNLNDHSVQYLPHTKASISLYWLRQAEAAPLANS